jgi:hypothetical protein
VAKESSTRFVFGVEMWTDAELRVAKDKLRLYSPDTLCARDGVFDKYLNAVLREIDKDMPDVTSLKRTDLFGPQARVYFADDGLLRDAVRELQEAFK